jgi:hypothetical protein
MEDIEVEQYEIACNKIFPGLQMFVRDTFLAKKTEEKYVIGKIIKEPTFCDVSCRVGGIITTHRYAILSNRFLDFSASENGTNWGLFVCKKNSFFKVLDIYKINGKTQISLLHLDENWKLFENINSNVEDDIIKMCRERFQNKYNMPPIPELVTKTWLERLIYPIGINLQNEYVSLNEETMDNINISQWKNNLIENRKNIKLKYGSNFGFNKDHINTIKKGFIPETVEDKWYIYSENDWIYFHRTDTGKRIYEAEIKNIDNRYIIDEFYVERKYENYDNTDDRFDIHILHILIDWGLLRVDSREFYSHLINKTEEDNKKLRETLGNFLFSVNEKIEYAIMKQNKYPCKDVFREFDKKFETFLFLTETFQRRMIIPINEIEQLLFILTLFSNHIENLYEKYNLFVNNKMNMDDILLEINKTFTDIWKEINEIIKIYGSYFINGIEALSNDEIINNLTDSNKIIYLPKEIMNKLLSYKTIINDRIFINEKMFGLFLF